MKAFSLPLIAFRFFFLFGKRACEDVVDPRIPSLAISFVSSASRRRPRPLPITGTPERPDHAPHESPPGYNLLQVILVSGDAS